MEGATVRAYAQPNCGPVALEVFVGDKRRGTVTLPSKGSGDFFIDGLDGHIESKPRAMVFMGWLRDAALEAKREV